MLDKYPATQRRDVSIAYEDEYINSRLLSRPRQDTKGSMATSLLFFFFGGQPHPRL